MPSTGETRLSRLRVGNPIRVRPVMPTRVRDGARDQLVRLWHVLLASFPVHVGRRSNELNLVRECLALAAQQTLCTIPLLVALQAVAQRFALGSVGSALSRYLGLSGEATRDVKALFIGSGRVSFLTLLVGLVISLVAAIGVAAIQQHAYEDIWYQPRRGLRSLWRQVIWVVGLVVYLFIALHTRQIGHLVGGHLPFSSLTAHVLRLAAVLVLSFVFYWWTQHLLLSGRIAWRHLFPGSLVMAVAMTGLVALSPLMSGQIVQQVEAYGLIGATFILAVWLLALSVVVFFGALIGSVWAERRELGPHARSELAEREDGLH